MKIILPQTDLENCDKKDKSCVAGNLSDFFVVFYGILEQCSHQNISTLCHENINRSDNIETQNKSKGGRKRHKAYLAFRM